MSTGFKKLSGSILSIDNRVFEHVLSHTYTFSFSLWLLLVIFDSICIIKYYWCVLFFSLKDSTTRHITIPVHPLSWLRIFLRPVVLLLLLFSISLSHKRDRKVDGWKINDDNILIFCLFCMFCIFYFIGWFFMLYRHEQLGDKEI